MEFLSQKMWSPYLVGALIGVLSWLTFFFSSKAIGCSTPFARLSGIIESIFRGKKAKEREYFKTMSFGLDWEFTFIIGMLGGAILSAYLSGSINPYIIPKMWEANFGDSNLLRIIVSVIGGILLGFGSRFSGGCTSGHGISGTMQMALSSWLVVPFFFIGGIIMSVLLYKVF